jgi:hypothetical protein
MLRYPQPEGQTDVLWKEVKSCCAPQAEAAAKAAAKERAWESLTSFIVKREVVCAFGRTQYQTGTHFAKAKEWMADLQS